MTYGTARTAVDSKASLMLLYSSRFISSPGLGRQIRSAVRQRRVGSSGCLSFLSWRIGKSTNSFALYSIPDCPDILARPANFGQLEVLRCITSMHRPPRSHTADKSEKGNQVRGNYTDGPIFNSAFVSVPSSLPSCSSQYSFKHYIVSSCLLQTMLGTQQTPDHNQPSVRERFFFSWWLTDSSTAHPSNEVARASNFRK